MKLADIQNLGLTKGEQRKLGALCNSVGDELGAEVFAKWYKLKQANAGLAEAARVDPAIEKLRSCLPVDPPLNLGVSGMLVKRSRKRGGSPYIIERIQKGG